MNLPPFVLHQPLTIDEAVATFAQHPGEADWLAGGTDLLPNYKWRLNAKPHVISLHRVEGLRDLTPTHIGAMVTLRELEGSAELQARLPVIPATARQVASVLLRASGTLGGNLMLENRCFYFNQSEHWRRSWEPCMKAEGDRCHVVPQQELCYATFSSDMAGTLCALDATAQLLGPQAGREVPLQELYLFDGIRRHARTPGELLIGVRLPECAPTWRTGYRKLRLRGSWDFPELGVAISIQIVDGALSRLRIVLNALEQAPRSLDSVTKPYVGGPLSDQAIEELAAASFERARPYRNTSFPPHYRRKMVPVFVRDLLRHLRDS